jgi:hypothetical protein
VPVVHLCITVHVNIYSIGTKEADLRLAHVTLMQEVTKLLPPEQQKTFRTMRERMMGMDSMMSMDSMMGRGHGER